MCVCVQLLSRMWFFANPWSVGHQAPLSMEFPRQEYWSGLPFLFPGDLPWLRGWTCVPCLASRFFTAAPLGKPCYMHEKSESGSRSVVANSLQPHGLQNPWNSLGQNTRVGSLSLLQGIFPIQGSNPGLCHCRWILYQLRYQGSYLHSLLHINIPHQSGTHVNNWWTHTNSTS